MPVKGAHAADTVAVWPVLVAEIVGLQQFFVGDDVL